MVSWARARARPSAVCTLQTWCPASQLLQPWLKGAKVQLRLASKGASLKTWQLCGVEPVGAQKSRFGTLHLDFRGYMKRPGCPCRSLLQRWNPYGEPQLGQCGREMWGWSPHTESPLGHSLVEQ
uniref:Uncharacterized protein n=1 Tax=Macaca fascicularis TaxID=9541 RepID=A0A7N9CG22_MACFA